MKKLIIIAIGLFVFIGGQAQDLPPNGDFENWSSLTLFEQPEGYNTSNLQVFFEYLTFNASKSTDAHGGSYALKLETITNAQDTAFGWAVYGDPEHDFAGGFPFTGTPDSMKVWLKYNCDNDDSVAILVLFKKFGIPIAGDFHYLYGQQNTWTEYTFPTGNFVVAPDTVLLGFASSNPESDLENYNPGNWIMVDDVSFTGTSQTIPNAGFEDWSSFQSEEPQGWSSFNLVSLLTGSPISVTKSMDAQNGSYALEITTTLLELDEDQLPIGVATTGTLVDGELGGGFALSQKPDSISFYYKYDNSNNTNDTALFYIQFSKYNSTTKETVVLDSGIYQLTPASAYTYVSLPFDLFGLDIDSANIVLSSSSLENVAYVGVGNELIVDNMVLHFETSSIPLESLVRNQVVFPNPASDYINVKFNLQENNSKAVLTFYDMGGRTVMSYDLKGLVKGENIVRQDISNLGAGEYIYALEIDGIKLGGAPISIVR